MSIDHMFLFALASSLQSTLIEKLGLGSKTAEARCAAYLAEDESVVRERAELEGKMRRLESVKEELLRFHEST